MRASARGPDLLFDGAAVPIGHRRHRWQEFVGDHLAEAELSYLDGVRPTDSYGGTLRVRACGGATFARVRSANQRLLRPPERIRGAARDTFLLTFVLRGECRVAQQDRRTILRCGDFCLYESARPYEIAAPGELDALVVMVDREWIAPMADVLRDVTAVAVGHADLAGVLARRFWYDLAASSRHLEDAKVRRLAVSGFDLLATALVDRDFERSAALIRAKLFVVQNSHRSTLAVADAARAAGLSVRRLQELFQEEGTTFGGYIRDTRLDRARERLIDANRRRESIGTVAYGAGFADPSYFARAFHRRFGVTPRSVRRP